MREKRMSGQCESWELRGGGVVKGSKWGLAPDYGLDALSLK